MDFKNKSDSQCCSLTPPPTPSSKCTKKYIYIVLH